MKPREAMEADPASTASGATFRSRLTANPGASASLSDVARPPTDSTPLTAHLQEGSSRMRSRLESAELPPEGTTAAVSGTLSDIGSGYSFARDSREPCVSCAVRRLAVMLGHLTPTSTPTGALPMSPVVVTATSSSASGPSDPGDASPPRSRTPVSDPAHVSQAKAYLSAVTDFCRYASRAYPDFPSADPQDFYDKLPERCDYGPLVRAAMAKHGLSLDEAHVIFGYTTRLFYWYLNVELRSPKGPSAEAEVLAKLLDTAIAKMPRCAEREMHRGYRFDDPSGPGRLVEWEAEYKLGSRVDTLSPWSCGPSADDGYAGERRVRIATDQARELTDLAFGVHFHHLVGKPVYARETILPRGLRFDVTGVETSADGKVKTHLLEPAVQPQEPQTP